MPKITIQDFLKKKAEKKKITMITADDYPFAKIVDVAGIDGIIVGDSVGMVVQGFENTLPVTMDEMIYHTKIVSRAAQNAMVVGDLPFMSYQASVEEAVRNAGRFLKEAGASAVKIEGGAEVADHIRAMTKSDIPVMAHIGLTPQSIHRMGGYKVQGKTEESAKRLIEEAHIVEDAGAFDPAALLARYPDRRRYLIAPASIRSRIVGVQGDSLGTIYLIPNALHVASGTPAGDRLEVRTGRSGIPYVVGGR